MIIKTERPNQFMAATLLLSLFPQTRRALTAGVIALACVPAFATTFTNNTSIGVGNTNYDGTAIVVTNCTLTVDGPHAFSSVLVAAGGVLTHSFYPSGAISSNPLFITNESQVLSGTNPVTLLNSNVITATVEVTDSTGTIVYTNGVDYLLFSTNDDLTDLEQTTNSSIPNGATVLVSYEVQPPAVPAGLNLSVTGNVEVDAGGAINANGNGYGGRLGSGAGNSSAGSPQDGSGAGYGGIGGMSSSNAMGGATYGSFTQPANLGSGGGAGYAGAGGAGGGMIEIVAGGSVIANGPISANGANGTNARSGGGSGGSVWLTALMFSGSGAITANGGNGDPNHGGGGGGGRIAVQCGATDFAGSMTAYGGAGANIGGAGTVYTKLTGENGLLVVDNGGQSGTNTPLAIANSTIDVLIQGNAGVMPSGAWTVGNLTIASNGLLLASPSTTLALTVAGALMIEPGGGLLANAAGYTGGGGSGAGHSYDYDLYFPCGGGGYGGNGAASSPTNGAGGTVYGSQLNPTAFGSGGGTLLPYSLGGSGGGAIQITSLSGIVQVDGTISANGGNGSGSGGGGGSGGSIWLTGGTLLGSGSITANGGNGANSIGGGGGGGRIDINPTANLFDGTISAYGGDGGNWGGAGTVLIQATGQNQLILDNDGQAGANTLVQSASSTDLIVRGGAVGSASSSVSFANLYLNPNGWLTPAYNSSYSPADTLTFSFSGNATVEAGGGIVADFAGYAGGQGNGEGSTYESGVTYFGGGGGHGGYGGRSFGNYAAGGNTYDSMTSPSDPGSGGGTVSSLSPGGPGGGVIRLTVTGALEMDGIISANGGNGSGDAGGGGSGGSIWLAVGTLAGAGSIAANGGNGADALGGGGGGGMIYIPYNNNSFSGTVTAYGGGGANWGGAGTTIIQATGKNSQLILDGGGHAGPATPLPSSSTTDLTLRNGAVCLSGTGFNLGNVLISSNSFLLVSNTESYVESASMTMSSATIQAGGGIIADFQGYAAGQGVSAGHYDAISPTYPCSGGGLGGNGGNSSGNFAVGGSTGGSYDTPTSPETPGSGGGTYSPYSVGGRGGGAFHLTVTGLLQVDGAISANGGNGGGFGGGGGSGGSIWLTAGTLAGAGSITANGGSGAGSVGGGGGGGSIAIYPTVNQYAGTISAYGGGGANWGGAGTVFIEITGQNGQLILDNDGQSGATTPIQSVSSSTALIVRNGAVGLPGTSLSLGNVLISSNGWLLMSNSSYVTGITLSSATIQAGGGIIADSAGYPAGQGTGAGNAYASSPTYPCSGAGHGGNGGKSAGNFAAGGGAYDYQMSPNMLGSGGGTYETYSVGGAGGGAFRITVTGLLQVDGAISANGGNGSGSGGGGGSGGGIYLSAGTLSGAGSITANGGSGAGSVGGGGAGGCIAIYPTANLFTGAISAYGGGGANWGGAGTVYIQTTGQSPSTQFILDNGEQSGAATPIQSVSSASAIILRNGAVGYQQTSQQTFASLLVSSNAWLMANPISGNNNPGIVNLTITGNATVQAGGGIVTDNAGSAAGSGGGAGQYYYKSPYYLCSGAGYGGYGAVSSGNLAAGGVAYGSITSPSINGSGGGNYSPYSIGGAGGGSVRLTVNGTLDAEGKISANGGNGSGLGGGGGSGGSIWLTVGTLAGVGSITANGGNGADGVGGGGGGGRISVGYTANDFVGLMTAYGGGGYAQGGAGTIYTKANTQSTGQLLLDNGGVAGTNTPLSSIFGIPSQPFNLTIGNGAIVCPQTSFPLLNNLTIASGGLLTISSSQSTLDLLVFNNVNVESGGVIAVDGEGYPQGGGPGAGQSREEDGSGAGYGGAGGASATAPGGASYGSINQPVDFGSGGGFGGGPLSGGSEGGGAIRLSVGGILTVDGQISADGEPGLQDNSGGGSGGSIWVTAGTLAGIGQFTADGGAGELYGGGGGAGGRIALYSHANGFFGLATASGAGGDSPGAEGTIYSNNVPPLQVLSNSPVGIVSNGVSSVTLYFNDAPNPNSFPATAVSLTTPNGPLSSGSFSISMSSSASYVVSFPLETAVGNYVLTVGPNINDLYGQPMSQVYTGAFTISLPVIQGVITDTNSQPVAGILLQPSAGLSSTTTDTNGNYALGFVPGSSFTVTPSLGALVFVPGAMSYTNISASVSNQNYLAVSTIAANLTAGGNATNFALGWQAISGVNYQVYSSTDLINWLPYGAAFTGSNGPVQILVPIGGSPMQFFSVQSGN
jgi:hypothetical protein